MNCFKTIAFALAISTGACTVQAMTKSINPRSYRAGLIDGFKFAAATYLTYQTLSPIVKRLAFAVHQSKPGPTPLSRSTVVVDRYGPMRRRLKLIKAAQALAFVPTWNFYHRLLTRGLDRVLN